MFFHHHTEQLKSEADHVSLQIKTFQGLAKEHRNLHDLTRPLLFSLTSAKSATQYAGAIALLGTSSSGPCSLIWNTPTSYFKILPECHLLQEALRASIPSSVVIQNTLYVSQ